MEPNQDRRPWLEVVGALIVLTIISFIALCAVGGWKWAGEFLGTAGPAWLQAIGAVLAIYAAWNIAETQSNERVAASHATAKIAVLRVYTPFIQLASIFRAVKINIDSDFGAENKASTFAVTLDMLREVRFPSDEQFASIGTLHPELARTYAAAASHLESMTFIMGVLHKRNPLTDADLAGALAALKNIVALTERSLEQAQIQMQAAYQAASQ